MRTRKDRDKVVPRLRNSKEENLKEINQRIEELEELLSNETDKEWIGMHKRALQRAKYFKEKIENS